MYIHIYCNLFNIYIYSYLYIYIYYIILPVAWPCDVRMFSHNGYGPGISAKGLKAAGSGWGLGARSFWAFCPDAWPICIMVEHMCTASSAIDRQSIGSI